MSSKRYTVVNAQTVSSRVYPASLRTSWLVCDTAEPSELGIVAWAPTKTEAHDIAKELNR